MAQARECAVARVVGVLRQTDMTGDRRAVAEAIVTAVAVVTGFPTGELERREQVAREQVDTVLSRWRPPRLYSSFAAYQRELAVAYQARADVFADAVDQWIDQLPGLPHLMFAALLAARQGCRDSVHEARREAREAARWDQEQAWRSYADNLAAARVAGQRAVA